MLVKLTWQRINDRKGVWLRAHPPEGTYSREVDEAIAEIVRWSTETKCGQRMAYDMWLFRTEEQLLLFMLRWA